MEKKKAKAKAKRRRGHMRRPDYAKKERLKYYCFLSCILLLVLACVAAGMFLYLKHESEDTREEFTSQLQAGMLSAKNTCVETLESIDADQNYIDNINMRYENAMAETDILQQYYLVDGMLDYTLSSLYEIHNTRRMEAAQNNQSLPSYEDEMQIITTTQDELKAVKEQISAIDLTKYY